MTEIKAEVVLTDIEGTTTAISFVKDVLFPYALDHVGMFYDETRNQPETQEVVEALKSLDEYQEFLESATQAPNVPSTTALAKYVRFLMERDLKVGPLKTLQGLIWSRGYANGSLKGHVYDDVPPALRRWQAAGLRIAIYSSGSVKAQQLLFGQSVLGDLLPFISSHFDTSVGHKQDKKSYEKIAQKLGVPSSDILFLTDIVKEAEAARAAGMQAMIVDRPGNAPLTDDDKSAFAIIKNFNDLQVSRP